MRAQSDKKELCGGRNSVRATWPVWPGSVFWRLGLSLELPSLTAYGASFFFFLFNVASAQSQDINSDSDETEGVCFLKNEAEKVHLSRRCHVINVRGNCL